MADAQHDELIREQFTAQAASFEDPTYSFADERLLRWIHGHLPAWDGRLVLDVAGGTGIVGRSLAGRARQVVVLDATPEMLATGHAAAGRAGLDNVLFLRGDATRMPFSDQSFDLVVSRFAVHHFAAPEAALAEMARVVRPGGSVVVIDLVAPTGADGATYDEIERLRDPSHVESLPAERLAAALGATGLSVGEPVVAEQRVDVERWLAQSQPAAEVAAAIRRLIQTELEDAGPAVMRPSLQEGRLRFTQTWAIVRASSS